MFSSMLEPVRPSTRRNSGPPAVPPGYEAVHFRNASGLLPLIKMQLAEGIENPAETVFLQQPFDVAVMTTFKVARCPKQGPHDWNFCPFAHPGENACRRDPRLYNYSGVKCRDKRRGKFCCRGDNCPNAHNVFELWLHPRKFRTELCEAEGSCDRVCCFFAHSREELRHPDDPLPAAYYDAPLVTPVHNCHVPAPTNVSALPHLNHQHLHLPTLPEVPEPHTGLLPEINYSAVQTRMVAMEFQRQQAAAEQQLQEERMLQQALQRLMLGQHKVGLGSLPTKSNQLAPAPLASAPAATGAFGWDELPPVAPLAQHLQPSLMGELPMDTRQLLQQLVQWRAQANESNAAAHGPQLPGFAGEFYSRPAPATSLLMPEMAKNHSLDIHSMDSQGSANLGNGSPHSQTRSCLSAQSEFAMSLQSMGSGGEGSLEEQQPWSQAALPPVVPAYALAVHRALQNV